MPVMYGFDTVRELLPQSYPMIMIDTVEELERGRAIVCRKNISAGDWCFPGHFPRKAIYPGVLITEGMAQTGILLYRLSEPEASEEAEFLLTAVKSRFLKPVVPGDSLLIRCETVKWMSHAGIVSCTASVHGETVSQAELTFGILHGSGDEKERV
ncbi:MULTISPECIES: 3-hydroxyacyl-ACP dehydratase FabZ [Paenibacillus]|uniref:3-hydroxyacyl-ACP dehydratase FabZ n=1 Tax=Paenibacillus TaxID=44249 RepID=UPI0022B92635|nr:3-hydroxyacyl-ACP dehydratase FabZ [Paenibacillus caseinilyticus]MCZ8519467.1 3-hydroxyacyl-ACP dehydratase FabZ [Paenibacillus caseinilyticus]